MVEWPLSPITTIVGLAAAIVFYIEQAAWRQLQKFRMDDMPRMAYWLPSSLFEPEIWGEGAEQLRLRTKKLFLLNTVLIGAWVILLISEGWPWWD